MCRKTRSHLSPTPRGQSFARRWARAGRKFRHHLVEVRATEHDEELLIENPVERVEVDDRAALIVDGAAHGHIDAVQVAVVARWAAGFVAMSAVQRQSPRQRTRCWRAHQAMPSPKRTSGVSVYCPEIPVGLRAFGAVVVPGCLAGSWLYDTGYESFQNRARTSSRR